MKTLLLLFLTLGMGFFTQAKNGKLTVDWKFSNVVEGYNHQNKITIFSDGKKIGESEAFLQDSWGTYTVSVPTGKHQLRIVSSAFYEGQWEEHTVANNYSIDAIYDQELQVNTNTHLTIDWDLDNQNTHIDLRYEKSKKTKKPKKQKMVPLKVSWNFTGIIEGYDHQCRVKVYIDQKLVATSSGKLQSEGGKIEIKVPAGSHHIRIITEAFYQEKWEEHTRENNYSIDAFIDEEIIFKSANEVQLTFDIDSEKTTKNWKIR